MSTENLKLKAWFENAREVFGWKKMPQKKLIDHIWCVIAPLQGGPSRRIEVLLHAIALLLEEALGEDTPHDLKSLGLSLEECVAAFAFPAVNICSSASLLDETTNFLTRSVTAIEARARSVSQPDDFSPAPRNGTESGDARSVGTRLPPSTVPLLNQDRTVPPEHIDPRATADQRRRTKCAGCGFASSGCVCVVVPSGPRVRQPPPLPPPPPTPAIRNNVPAGDPSSSSSSEESDSTPDADDTAAALADDVTSLQTGAALPSRRVKLSRLEDPAILLDTSRWAQAISTHGALDFVRAFRVFYNSTVAESKPHDERFMGDILLCLARAFEDPSEMVHLTALGDRIVARFEFHRTNILHGKEAAAAAEDELTDRNLPEAVRRARRVAEKRASNLAKKSSPQSKPTSKSDRSKRPPKSKAQGRRETPAKPE